MVERSADRVTVPDVVGLPVHFGRDVANEAGVALANPDPDGPPLAELTWPGLFYITSQSPAAGSTVYRWDSVAVETVPWGEVEASAVVTSPEPPHSDITHAAHEPESYTDLTDEDQPNPY